MQGVRSLFEGKVALIFGGASGIGKRTAQRFAREGAKVVIGDISVDGLTELKKELGAACATIQVNVTNEAEVEKAVAAAVSNFGRLDIAVNCAAKSGLNRIVDLTEEEWKSDIGVSLTGTFLCMKHEGRQMIKQEMGGSIINICSLSSKLPGVGRATYCSSKAAVDMLTRVGALELAPHKIRVNAVSPGLTDTPLTALVHQTPNIYQGYLENMPLGRTGTTDDIAAAVLFLASDDASWITGVNLSVDGGWHMTRYPDVFKLLEGMK